MDRSNETVTPVRIRTTKEPQSTADPAEHRDHLGLTWRQRLLAAATATAILVSGLNALVQMWKVVFKCNIMGP